MAKAVLFDLDGTLVNSNEQHVDIWAEVFGEAGHSVDREAIRGQIGKGGDLLVPALVPSLRDDEQKKLADRHGELFKERCLQSVRPFPSARDLVEGVHRRGAKIVLASSASSDELKHYCSLLKIADFVDATTSSDDVGTTKPAPDIFSVGLKKLSGIAAADAVAVGDTPYDVEAAGKCGIRTIALRSGGFDDEALNRAGAVAIYQDAADLLAHLDDSPLAH